MKRPLLIWLLLAFLGLQWVWNRGSGLQPVAGTAWIRVGPISGGRVRVRDHRAYLQTTQGWFRIRATGALVSLVPRPVQEMVVPQPSGAGSWSVAVSPSGVALAGGAGTLRVAPDGRHILWWDPGSGLAYVSLGVHAPLYPLGIQVNSAADAAWAPDGRALAVFGRRVGGRAAAVYVWDGGRQVSRITTPPPAAELKGLGFAAQESVVAAYDNGLLWWQAPPTGAAATGNNFLRLPGVPLALFQGSVLAQDQRALTLWASGQTSRYALPVGWTVGRHAYFDQSGDAVAVTLHRGAVTRLLVLGLDSGDGLGRWHWVLDGPGPGRLQIAGWVGDRWLLVNAGTRGLFAWWMSRPGA